MNSIAAPSFGEPGQLGERNSLWLWSDIMGIGDTLQAVLDALTAHIAILDASGTIMAINHAWRQFAEANGLESQAWGLGTNYLTVCERAQGDEAARAHAGAQGIRKVLNGRRDTYCIDYQCAGPAQDHWFRLRVRPLPAPDVGQVLVTHDDRTEFRQLQAAYQHVNAALLERHEWLQTENRSLQDDLRSDHGFEDIVGRSPALLGLLGLVEQVAPTGATGLLLGATGTGKERIAHALDRRSQRLDEMERAHLQLVLEVCNWRIKGARQAAERLGLNPSTLWSRMKKLGITRPQA